MSIEIFIDVIRFIQVIDGIIKPATSISSWIQWEDRR